MPGAESPGGAPPRTGVTADAAPGPRGPGPPDDGWATRRRRRPPPPRSRSSRPWRRRWPTRSSGPSRRSWRSPATRTARGRATTAVRGKGDAAERQMPPDLPIGFGPVPADLRGGGPARLHRLRLRLGRGDRRSAARSSRRSRVVKGASRLIVRVPGPEGLRGPADRLGPEERPGGHRPGRPLALAAGRSSGRSTLGDAGKTPQGELPPRPGQPLQRRARMAGPRRAGGSSPTSPGRLELPPSAPS